MKQNLFPCLFFFSLFSGKTDLCFIIKNRSTGCFFHFIPIFKHKYSRIYYIILHVLPTLSKIIILGENNPNYIYIYSIINLTFSHFISPSKCLYGKLPGLFWRLRKIILQRLFPANYFELQINKIPLINLFFKLQLNIYVYLHIPNVHITDIHFIFIKDDIYCIV